MLYQVGFRWVRQAVANGQRRRRWLARAVWVVVLATSSRVALAQQSDDEPGDRDAYPTALVERPIVMPAGWFEAEARLTAPVADLSDAPSSIDKIALFDLLVLDVGGRLGVGRFDARVGAGFIARNALPSTGEQEPSALLSVGAGGQLRLTRETAVGLDALFFDWVTELDATLRYKRRFGRRYAVRVDGGFGVWDESGIDESLWVLSVAATARAQVQIAPWLAAQGGLAFDTPVVQRPTYDGSDGPYAAASYRIDAVAGVLVHAVDGFDAYAELELIGNDLSRKGLCIGALLRTGR